jgi:hypothetical protein
MNVMPVASFLKDFSSYVPEPVEFSADSPLLQSPEPVDNTEAIEAARAEGVAQGREEALAEMQSRFAELEAAFEARLAQEREAWAADHGAKLAGAMLAGLDAVRDEVIGATAQVLKPFLVEAVRQKALAGLARTIDDMLLRDPETGFVISGPEDLLKALELRLSERAGNFTFKPSDSPEIEVKAGAALLATRIASWVEKINEA